MIKLETIKLTDTEFDTITDLMASLLDYSLHNEGFYDQFKDKLDDVWKILFKHFEGDGEE